MASSTPPRPPRTRGQIEADLAATRGRLANSVEGLVDQVHPNRIKQRTIASAKQLASDELDNAKSLVFNARGDLRQERVVAAAAAVAGFISFVLILRAIVRRSRS